MCIGPFPLLLHLYHKTRRPARPRAPIPPMNREAIQPRVTTISGAHVSVGVDDGPTIAPARVLGKRPHFAPLQAPMSLEHSNEIPKSNLEPLLTETTQNRLVPHLSYMQTNELCSASDCPSPPQATRAAFTSTQLSEQHSSKIARAAPALLETTKPATIPFRPSPAERSLPGKPPPSPRGAQHDDTRPARTPAPLIASVPPSSGAASNAAKAPPAAAAPSSAASSPPPPPGTSKTCAAAPALAPLKPHEPDQPRNRLAAPYWATS